MLRTVVDLTFLALAVVLITTLLADRYDSVNEGVAAMGIQKLRKDIMDISMKNMIYLENKVNRVAEASDSYQVDSYRRIQVLENRMESLEARSKSAPRVNNINTNTVNK